MDCFCEALTTEAANLEPVPSAENGMVGEHRAPNEEHVATLVGTVRAPTANSRTYLGF